ncbi:hypothetical protein Asulf_01563 [Archaeoglobus sulfaticallidus PM70-1]|uniref:Thioredoxin domain-containing protein n=1 Tax=Archaeoglobus sulfaticallidus PM70-1 TaxID=387631 RepID=N0BMR3_9EURY|nr:thioredoxin domain-containing protein [Archaeoglobus sulfaticallidus]AGK61540.1 hypothetical protein Asulf_01563 [Archaeoglobus sulfaticallidus PM70-1]
MNNEKIFKLNKNNWREIVGSGVVVVDFYADWCPPCFKIEPILEELAEAFKNKVKVCKFNVEEDDEIPTKYGIQVLPTIYVFKNGDTYSGVEGLAKKESIFKLVESALYAE